MLLLDRFERVLAVGQERVLLPVRQGLTTSVRETSVTAPAHASGPCADASPASRRAHPGLVRIARAVAVDAQGGAAHVDDRPAKAVSSSRRRRAGDGESQGWAHR